ncbi:MULTISPECIES: stage IV sporulation protein A [Rummeliibacillus]|uniref:Stage IV sporulation protein B n=1 Tax=Rummeliibacillus stabekisii TaxID=241244 RepID=A0A143HA72_9BACL|nr:MULTISPECIES: stage IV sporulation protein A [Rummeliibacillus]AMW98633.1 stage IV sporulation protein B [Rummeliibacillus stabekisii]MBB5169727.1 stage IV sporulation protein A [Rummeliibacillus stabekisii]MCM3315965.1 stage IV sporulation protein A [Rummeliibacillus stabekisii]GEL03984.1 stage IV sporulation protein A [Rummeliibacillus stabekisii]
MSQEVYEQMATRTNGDIYIGVVGPVRVGKSTFTKRVMDIMVLPNMEDEKERQRAQDELPQSSPGPVIMTTEPKFVPANGAQISVGNQDMPFKIRFADCVGYIIDGVKGYEDENGPKLVHTPWHNDPIPFQDAAKIGTDKIIREHANIGVVMTTDGTVNGIPRESVRQAEQDIIDQLQEIGKPFVIVVNSKMPAHTTAKELCDELHERYNAPVISTSVDQMTLNEVKHILEEALYEFPIKKLEMEKPDWLDVLEENHELNKLIKQSIDNWKQSVNKIRDIERLTKELLDEDFIASAQVKSVDAGLGHAIISLQLKNDIFKNICDEWLEEPIQSKKDWLLFIKESQQARKSYQRFHEAIEQARKDGYGVTLPTLQEFEPSRPEIIKQNNFFGVRMEAKAPSYHILRIDMAAEFAPLIGSEFHSQQLLKDLTYAFLHDRDALWETQLFGTPLFEVMKESIAYKTDAVPKHAKARMRQTIEKMVNKGDSGMVTFIL